MHLFDEKGTDHLQIFHLGQHLKLSVTSVICNKALNCRINGEGSVPIITEGTLLAVVWGCGTSFCPAGDQLLYTHTCMHGHTKASTHVHELA